MNTVMQAPSGVTGSVQTAYGNASIGSTGLVTVDSRAVANLEAAGFSVVGVNVASGSHVITSGEASANQVVIATGLGTVIGQVVQVLTAANVVGTSDAVITHSAGNITVADGSTYNTVAGAIINWVAFGYPS